MCDTTKTEIELIEQLKAERDAVILAHYYVDPAVQALADHVGDSFALAKLAASLPNKTLVFCGVKFMGESAKLLSPDKTVLMPAPQADCPMAHMVTPERIAQMKETYDDLAIVTYVNSTAEIKSVSDVCVTSSNAIDIVRNLPQKNIFFNPDQNLGRFVAQQVPEKNIILNPGCCPHHNSVQIEQVLELKELYPDAEVLAHPECTAELLSHADFIGSTKAMIEYAEQSSCTDFIVVTVQGIIYELEQRTKNTNKRFFFTKTPPRCPDMDMVTVQGIIDCLTDTTGAYEVHVSDDITQPACHALQNMLDYAAR